MRLLLSLSAFCSLALAGTAMSADLRGSLDAAGNGSGSADTWTGVYVGLAGTGAKSTADWTAVRRGGPEYAISQKSGLGAVTIEAGADRQIGRLVFGIGVDASIAKHDPELVLAQIGSDPSNSTVRVAPVGSSLDWMATLRGRIGVPIGRALAYGHGGAVAAKSTVRAGSYRKRLDPSLGFVLGGGVETKISDKLSLVAEYGYHSLGKQHVAYHGEFSIAAQSRLHQVKTGLRVRF